MDLWQFTPLHEAASKNRVEVCSLLLLHGADPTLVNCHSKSALDATPTRDLADRIQCKSSRASLVYDFLVRISRDLYETILVGKFPSREISEKCASQRSRIIDIQSFLPFLHT